MREDKEALELCSPGVVIVAMSRKEFMQDHFLAVDEILETLAEEGRSVQVSDVFTATKELLNERSE
jgi:UTP-glucose-1-phosphate uridylyltransferase